MLNWFKKKPTERAVPPAPQPPEAQNRPAGGQSSEALRTKGNEELNKGNLDEAEKFYREASTQDPKSAKAFLNLGFVLSEKGDHSQAMKFIEHAALLDPWLADAHYMLGNLQNARGKVEQAMACYRQALIVKPDFADCRRDLCVTLAQNGQTREARAVLDGGPAFPPNSADYHYFIGNLHLVDNEFPHAIEQFARVAALEPSNAPALANKGLAQFKLGDVFSAIETFEQVLALQPDNVAALCNLGGAQQVCGRLDLAAESYARAMQLDPDYVAAQHNRLYALSFDPQCSPESYLTEARKTGAWMTAHARPYAQWPWLSPAADDRPLRIGFVSGDLRSHPVGVFLEGVVASINPARLTLVAYSTRPRGDQLTARIKKFFAQWNDVSALPDDALAAKIHADKIDILVDLAGHTAYNRLPVFAWRPAPIQVAWLGFFATTGAAEIDYIIVDPVSVPHEGRRFLSEQPWYLPDTRLCFTPPRIDRPLPVAQLPALRNGFVTFGSFQIYGKLSDITLTAWANVLTHLPTARLRLQSWQLGFEGASADVLARLARHGIDKSRVSIHGGAPRYEYLAAHGEVDVLLDTFPFPGGTTTVEALWMGVPTITLTGRSLLEKQGESLLRCAGLGDWVAHSPQTYAELAVSKTSDFNALARQRAGLRERVLASPLFDAARFARHLESAFAAMWDARIKKGNAPVPEPESPD